MIVVICYGQEIVKIAIYPCVGMELGDNVGAFIMLGCLMVNYCRSSGGWSSGVSYVPKRRF